MSIIVDELGPIDWIVVEFPHPKLTGGVAPTPKDRVDRDLIRVPDPVFLARDDHGGHEVFEATDMDEAISRSCTPSRRSWPCRSASTTSLTSPRPSSRGALPLKPTRKETDMPIAARRRRRTVAAVGGAVVVAHRINRRGDRRDDRRDRR